MVRKNASRTAEESKDRKELMEKPQGKNEESTYSRQPNHLRSQ